MQSELFFLVLFCFVFLVFLCRYDRVCSQYDWCFATDFRDVFFQGDPFVDLPPQYDLLLSEEWRGFPIGKCHINSEWVSVFVFCFCFVFFFCLIHLSGFRLLGSSFSSFDCQASHDLFGNHHGPSQGVQAAATAHESGIRENAREKGDELLFCF